MKIGGKSMKSFEEIKVGVRMNIEDILQRYQNKITSGLTDSKEAVIANNVIKNCQTYLANLNEITMIEIGSMTNNLIQNIQTAYHLHLQEYYQDFDNFLDRYILGMTPEGKPKPGSYLGQFECLILGFGPKELSCFRGISPLSNESGNHLRQAVNLNCGTKIPMAEELDQARKEYESAPNDDENAKDKAFIRLREMQRDAGLLRNGGMYYPLVADKAYQEAKSRISETVK